MNVEIRQTIDAALDVVVRAKDERYEHTDKIEGLKKLDFKEKKEDDASVSTKRDFDINMDKTPPPIRKMLPSDMFSFTEIARWDKKTNRQEWEMVSKAKDKLTWKGSTSYVSKGGATERVVECTIKVKVPFIGDAIEKSMASGFKKSMEKDLRTLNDMVNLIKEGKV